MARPQPLSKSGEGNNSLDHQHRIVCQQYHLQQQVRSELSQDLYLDFLEHNIHASQYHEDLITNTFRENWTFDKIRTIMHQKCF